MKNMVNTKHDTISYESIGYKREIFNIEVLYNAFQKAKQNSDWKPEVQKFEINLLPELVKLHHEIKNRTYKFMPTNDFVLSERGKTRYISGDHIRDRVVKRALCDEVLIPTIRKYLIYDNGASLEGKGITFTRNRVEVHLRKFYMEKGNNAGGILLGDYSKFFDNIQHQRLMDMFKSIISDETSLWLLEKVFEQASVDVSYMSDATFADRMNVVFNSLDHYNADKTLLTGEKILDKRMNIGDQVAQVAGIFYPHRLDDYVKIVEGIKFYGRYMDDYYVIHEDIDYLVNLQTRIEEQATESGLFINEKKTRICKVSDYWRFLKIQYSLTDTGRIVKKINPENITRMRRKLKKLVNIMSKNDFVNYYKAWFRNNYKNMSKQQRENMDMLFYNLLEVYYV